MSRKPPNKNGISIGVLRHIKSGVPIDIALTVEDVHVAPETRARAEFQVFCIERIMESRTGWQRFQWLLQQMDPLRWGEKDWDLDELDEDRMISVIQELIKKGRDKGFKITAKRLGC